jgi:hypothetical protein
VHRAAIALAAASCLFGVAVARGRGVPGPSGILHTRNVNGAYADWALDGTVGDGPRLVDAASDPVWSPDGSPRRLHTPALGGPETVSTTETARHEFVGTERPRAGRPAAW